MKIGEFLKVSRQQLVTCGPDDSVEAAAQLLHRHRIGAMPVCEPGPAVRMVGIISERDIVAALAMGTHHLETMRVRDLMTVDVVTCTPEESMRAAQDMMRSHRFRHLPILEDRRLLGILSLRDTLANRLEESRVEIDVLREYAVAARCLPGDHIG